VKQVVRENLNDQVVVPGSEFDPLYRGPGGWEQRKRDANPQYARPFSKL
jgi:hypothetical protein